VTKQLVSLNDKNLALGDNAKFQLILVGYDQSKEGNEGYLTSKGINFPAVKVEGRDSVKSLLSIGETGFIPNIVLLDASGKMVSNDRAEVLEKLTELAGG